jgi:hypothetical protein
MLLRKRLKDPNLMRMVGCVALIVANVAQFVLHRNGALPESISDPVSGFLFGIAIGTLLLSIIMRVRVNGSGCAS